MPYRVDLTDAGDDVLDRLVELGAMDVERVQEGQVAALMPDSVAPERMAEAFGSGAVSISPAVGRDDDSVWVLNPRPVHAGRVRINPSRSDPEPGALRLIDAGAFGTGLHPTTTLCLEAIDAMLGVAVPESVLDVGTGSGVLALGALLLGVPRATAIDLDADALDTTMENARLNGMAERLQVFEGGPGAVQGRWPVVLANILAAPLIEMAPSLVQRVGHHGRLVLSGIPRSLEHEVGDAYRRLGMRGVNVRSRAGWVALELQASW